MSTATAPSAAAKTLHKTLHNEVQASDIAVGVVVGRTSEYFDFFVFAIASVIVFPKLVFPYTDALTATFLSFAIFALAFISRPVGTLLFMEVDRRYGRSIKLISGLLLLGTATVAIAFLPGYASIGLSSAFFLALFRIAQGLAWGGTWDGMASLLSLHAPQGRTGWYAMIPQLGAPIGLIVASGLFAFFISNLSADDFFSWGWRYPFFVAFAINVVALFARLRLVTTPEFATLFANRELQPKSVPSTVRKEGAHIAIGTFTPLASFAMFHMVTVFPLSWIFLFTKESADRFLVIEMIAAAIGILAIAASGLIADRIGRRQLLVIVAGAIAAFSGFAPQLLNGGELGEVCFMVVGFILLGLSFGQSSGAAAHMFNRSYRYTASALTTDLAWLFGAGFAPLLALWLASWFGLIASGAYLLSGALGTVIALALSRSKQA